MIFNPGLDVGPDSIKGGTKPVHFGIDFICANTSSLCLELRFDMQEGRTDYHAWACRHAIDPVTPRWKANPYHRFRRGRAGRLGLGRSVNLFIAVAPFCQELGKFGDSFVRILTTCSKFDPGTFSDAKEHDRDCALTARLLTVFLEFDIGRKSPCDGDEACGGAGMQAFRTADDNIPFDPGSDGLAGGAKVDCFSHEFLSIALEDHMFDRRPATAAKE
jgi:hypothetical protein